MVVRFTFSNTCTDLFLAMFTCLDSIQGKLDLLSLTLTGFTLWPKQYKIMFILKVVIAHVHMCVHGHNSYNDA